MNKILEDKVCFVTGANRGIGAAIVKKFAYEGALVYANARKEGSIDISEFCDFDGKVFPVYFDIRESENYGDIFSKIWKEQGKLDVMVNNAGIVYDAFVGMINRKKMEDMFETNIYAVIDLIQYAAKFMKKNKSGSIINLSSAVGIYGNQGQTAYSASKGAVISATKSASKELANYNIRVNAVAPGMIDTDMLQVVDEEKKQKYLSKIAMGRYGYPEEIANVCVMLASEYTSYIMGQIIEVSGGLSL